MIRHLFKMIWNQRRQYVWIAAELFMVLVVLWYIVDTLYVTGKVFLSPQGYDISQVYKIELDVDTEMEDDGKVSIGESYLTIADRIRTYPGVEAVGISRFAIPFSGMNFYYKVYMENGSDFMGIIKDVTPGFMDVFRFEPAEGEKLSWEEMLAGNHWILSDDIYETVKGKGGDRHSAFYLSSGFENSQEYRIGGVTTPFRRDRFAKDSGWFFRLLKDEQIAEMSSMDKRLISIFVKVSPEANKGFSDRFVDQMEEQLSVGSVYLVDALPYTAQRDSYELLDEDLNKMRNQMVIIGFLLFNIFLGIIGTFWYRTELKRAETGLRIALGSSRFSLEKLLIGEGLALLCLMAVPAFLVCMNLQIFEITDGYYMDYTIGRLLFTFMITCLLIACMIVIGIWYPARQVTRLNPAEALNYE